MRSAWTFDPLSAFIAAVGTPVMVYLAAIVVKHMKDLVGYVVDGVLTISSPILKKQVAARLSLRKYCLIQLKGNNRYLNVPSKSEVVLDTDEVFVTLRLEGGIGTSTVTHENILNMGSRLRVIGDPGSGKSSLVKKIFRTECYRALRGLGGVRLPISLELRELSDPGEKTVAEAGKWLLGLLRERVSTVGAYDMGTCFDVYSRTNGLLILLDGLDEVVTQHYPNISRAIRGLAAELDASGPENQIILTMRTHFHQQVRGDFATTFAHSLVVQPFSPTDIYEFLSRWPYPKSKDARVESARIYRDLMDRPTLREMCTNPLILAMYVAEDQTSADPTIPETRTEFYSRVCDEMIVKRRLRQTGMALGRAALKQQREKILGAFALDHLLNPQEPANSLAWRHAVEIVQEFLGAASDDAERILREIGKETGLITEEQEGETARFIHLTFCEFLAAKEAVERGEIGWRLVIETHQKFAEPENGWLRARLIEVLPFAVALLPRAQRQSALTALAEMKDSRLLLRALMETKAYDHPAWPQLVRREYNRLRSTPRDKWDEEWLRDMHMMNVVMRDAKLASEFISVRTPTVEVSDFIRGAGKRDRARLEAVLGALAKHDAAAALRMSEMAAVDLPRDFPEIAISNLDQPPFFALILERALRGEEDTGFWFQFLAEAGLRSRVVRNYFAAQTVPREWKQRLSAVPRIRRWDGPILRRDSLWGALVTLGIEQAKIVPQRSAKLLASTAIAPPPGKYRRGGKVWSAAAILGFVAVVLLTLVESGGAAGLSHSTARVMLGAIVVFELSLLVLFMRSLLIRGVYIDILNAYLPSPRNLRINSGGEVFFLSRSLRRYFDVNEELTFSLRRKSSLARLLFPFEGVEFYLFEFLLGGRSLLVPKVLREVQRDVAMARIRLGL